MKIRISLLMLLFCLTGCSFQQLQREVDQFEASMYVVGEVIDVVRDPSLIYAVVYSLDTSDQVTVRSLAIASEGPRHLFVLTLPPREDYRLAVFRDVDGDGNYREGEPIWFYHDGQPVTFGSNRTTEVIHVAFDTAASAIEPKLLRAIRDARARRPDLTGGEQLSSNIGKLADFADARFAPAVGLRGFWKPYSSLLSPGIGIYFLEPFDAARIPVLMVHGAAGTPRDLAFAASSLDERRFQIWMYAYPSGLPLADSSGGLAVMIARLRETYGFGEMHVIAHSMGGLVARRALELEVNEQRPLLRGKFITVATPWLGQEAAELGVAYAPAVIPSWKDLSIGSDYVTALFKSRLPPTIHSYLGFTYGGSLGVILPQSNDGTVSLSSQLRWDAQRAATELRGFNENHVSVLKSLALVSWIKGLLDD